MAGITLDNIRQAADDKYGPFVVEGVPGGDVTLVNALRLSKDKRKKLTDMQSDEDGDQDEKLRDMIRLVADSPASAKRLLDALGDDLAQLAVVLNEYGQAARLGEASPSAS